ncbi:MAG: DUF883 C-terminal domain-containing protein [Phycisphaerae bacterium]
MDGTQRNLSDEKIEEALNLLQEAARDQKNELKNLLQDKYSELKDVFFGGQMQENASACDGRGLDKERQVEHTFDQFIREQPLKAVLIGAGIGLLLGRFWKR